jgi:modulator of FtsH protease HflC
MKRNPLTLTIGILLIAIVALLLFVFQVRQSEVAIVTTFGKPTRPVITPGAHLKWPWPIQQVKILDQRIQNFEDKLTEHQTRDQKNVLTSVYLGWRITDPQAFYPRFAGSEDPIAEAERVLEGLVGGAKVDVIGKHSFTDLLSADERGNKFEQIEQEMLTALRAQVKQNNYGLEIEFLGLKKLGLPESGTQAVFDEMTKERAVLTSQAEGDGLREASKIKVEADRKAAETLSDANSKALQIKARGEAQAAESLKTFQQNPELAKFLFRLNALELSLKDRSILVFDQTTPPFDLFRGASTNLVK